MSMRKSLATSSAVKLSIVVVAYNMPRELPNTIRSLSMDMQIGIEQDDYEVLVIDNGSTTKFDELECRRWIPDIQFHYVTNASHSPVAALNKGLELANGDVIGVFIDGARLASPGLLAGAMEASCVSETAVIGTFAFHLGPDIQMRSIKNGYNQQVEDKLLADSDWLKDGYRLFEISTFAASSKRGWFSLPKETNALFMHRRIWEKLGGYEVGFVSPGGGLSNHDIWYRSCTLPESDVFMLLGEATFHQVHGGIATNAVVSLRKEFGAEYESIRKRRYQPADVTPVLFGKAHPYIFESLRKSTEKLTRLVS